MDSMLMELKSIDQPVHLQHHPLHIACSAYRHASKMGAVYYPGPLSDLIITDEDLDLAEKIKHYYCNRFGFSLVKGVEFSTFRKRLLRILGDNTIRIIPKDHIGILHKLVHFYYEDQLLENFCQQNYNSHEFDDLGTLTFLAKNHVIRNKPKTNFWMLNQDRNLILLQVNNENPLFGIVDSLFNLTPKVSFAARCRRRSLRLSSGTLTYFTMVNPSISAIG